MLTCKEIARLIASDELAERSLPLRLMIRVHVAICRKCGPYARALKRISGLALVSELGRCQIDRADKERVLQAVRAAVTAALGR